MLYDKLKKYSDSGIYPFHMPGHKRVNINPESTIPYNIDLTEIDGFDNLHNPSGCIRSVENKAEDLYCVKRAFLLVNGATGGILSSIRALTNFGDKVIMARNCHKSVYNAVELCGLRPKYILPDYDSEYGIFTSVSPNSLEALLKENTDARLVIITSPTYEGVASDIKSIAEICHRYNARLFVDEAHGAHFPFSDCFPNEAVKSGADVAVVSLHKTLPSLTQTALLLTNDAELTDSLRENLSVFETSSPSYILMSAIECCLDFISKNKSLFEIYKKNLSSFYASTKALGRLSVLYNDNAFAEKCFDFDLGKIIISTKDIALSGTELAEILRNEYKIETEMAYNSYVIAMTSVCDKKEGFARLKNALLEIDKEYNNSETEKNKTFIPKIPELKFFAGDRRRHKPDIIPFADAKGRVALEYVWAYPPGVPLIIPGEIIDDELISQINALTSSKTSINSTQNNMPKYISVVKSD